MQSFLSFRSHRRCSSGLTIRSDIQSRCSSTTSCDRARPWSPPIHTVHEPGRVRSCLHLHRFANVHNSFLFLVKARARQTCTRAGKHWWNRTAWFSAPTWRASFNSRFLFFDRWPEGSRLTVHQIVPTADRLLPFFGLLCNGALTARACDTVRPLTVPLLWLVPGCVFLFFQVVYFSPPSGDGHLTGVPTYRGTPLLAGPRRLSRSSLLIVISWTRAGWNSVTKRVDPAIV